MKKLSFFGKGYTLVFLFAILQVLAPREYSVPITITALIVLLPFFAIKLYRQLKEDRKKKPAIFLDTLINLAMLLAIIIVGYIIITV